MITNKNCPKCNRLLPYSYFTINRKTKSGLCCYCKECSKEYNKKYKGNYKDKEYHKKYYSLNRGKVNLVSNSIWRKQREECLLHYGGKCQCCNEDRYEFLSIDHIKGGGNKHRKEIGGKLVRWLRKNNYPKDFRVLCYNCNLSLGHHGYCPHNK